MNQTVASKGMFIHDGMGVFAPKNGQLNRRCREIFWQESTVERRERVQLRWDERRLSRGTVMVSAEAKARRL